MATSTDPKRITYNRESKDYDATFDGQYIGSFPNHHQAEVALNDYALDLIEQGLVDDMQILARPAEVAELAYIALPAASPAAAINARASDSSDGLGTPTGGREDAAPADPRAALIVLLKAALEEWQECGMATDYDVALAQLARLMTPPTGHFLCCPSCGGPHSGWQCPEVALVKYGMDVWEAYLEDRAAFLRLVQWATAARLLLMGDAVALYLSHRWRHAITAQQVLAGWQMQNAAPAS